VDDLGIVVRFLRAAVCCTLTHNLQIRSRDDLRAPGDLSLRGRGYKGPHPLLWATSRVARGKIAVNGIANSLSYCAIVIAYTELTNWLKVAQ